MTSTSEAAASAGSGYAVAPTHRGDCAHRGRGSLGDDVLERGPADDREQRVVEGEEGEIPARRVDDARRRRRRSRSGSRAAGRGAGRSRSRARVTTAIAPRNVPTAQMPTSASTTASDRRAVDAVEEEREERQRDELREREEGERGERLREPDRAAVARREHEAVEHRAARARARTRGRGRAAR